MDYLIGWGLLIGVAAIVFLVIRLAGGSPDEPHASCGLGGCCQTRPTQNRR
jgi:hypothetical protein